MFASDEKRYSKNNEGDQINQNKRISTTNVANWLRTCLYNIILLCMYNMH